MAQCPDVFPPPAEERTSETWLARSRAYADAVRGYQLGHGQDPDSEAALSTLRTNTELVPERADLLLDLLEELFGERMAGKRVLELGCGFGALGSYLAWCGTPSKMVSIDLRDDLLATATEACDSMGLSGTLTFRRADMRDLSELDGPFDIVIANNSFIYLASRDAMKQALDEIAKVTAGGAAVLFFHANKWRWHEPFTRAPIVHLIPPWAANALNRTKGWKHNHGRVRLVSPPELRRLLRRSEFETVGVIGYGKTTNRSGFKRNFGGYYALGARKNATRK